MEDIYQWQYFVFLAKNASKWGNCCYGFWSCHTADIMMTWLGCPVHLDTLRLWFFINSVGKPAAVPVPFIEGLLQMSVHYQKEIVFSYDRVCSLGFPSALRKPVCCSQRWCIQKLNIWIGKQIEKTNKSMTKKVVILKGKGLAYWWSWKEQKRSNKTFLVV